MLRTIAKSPPFADAPGAWTGLRCADTTSTNSAQANAGAIQGGEKASLSRGGWGAKMRFLSLADGGRGTQVRKCRSKGLISFIGRSFQ